MSAIFSRPDYHPQRPMELQHLKAWSAGDLQWELDSLSPRVNSTYIWHDKHYMQSMKCVSFQFHVSHYNLYLQFSAPWSHCCEPGELCPNIHTFASVFPESLLWKKCETTGKLCHMSFRCPLAAQAGRLKIAPLCFVNILKGVELVQLAGSSEVIRWWISGQINITVTATLRSNHHGHREAGGPNLHHFSAGDCSPPPLLSDQLVQYGGELKRFMCDAPNSDYLWLIIRNRKGTTMEKPNKRKKGGKKKKREDFLSHVQVEMWLLFLDLLYTQTVSKGFV